MQSHTSKFTNQIIVKKLSTGFNRSINSSLGQATRYLTECFKKNGTISEQKKTHTKTQVKKDVAQAFTESLHALGLQVNVVFDENNKGRPFKFEATKEAMESTKLLLQQQIDQMEKGMRQTKEPSISLEQKKEELETLKNLHKMIDPEKLNELDSTISASLMDIDKAIDSRIDQMSQELCKKGKAVKDRGDCYLGITIAVGCTLAAMATCATIAGGLTLALLVPGPGALIVGVLLATAGSISVGIGIMVFTACIAHGVHEGNKDSMENITYVTLKDFSDQMKVKLEGASIAIQESAKNVEVNR